jgi:hypothetical protein
MSPKPLELTDDMTLAFVAEALAQEHNEAPAAEEAVPEPPAPSDIDGQFYSGLLFV